jgi:UbiD family decarboxylase
MAYKGLRDWMEVLEKAGLLKHIKAKVDWDLEISGICRRVGDQQGPALLFENIKDYEKTACNRFFFNGLGTRERVAMALQLPRETTYRGIVKDIKDKLGKIVEPVKLNSSPVKQNIIKRDKVNLSELPVPRYNVLDGGRYIQTRGCIVTMDPDTRLMNVGMYRGMIGEDKKSIPVLLARSQHWGLHFTKYEQRGEEMPVAIAFGCDPILLMCASTAVHHPNCSEYEVAGGLSGEPVELVKCETSDLYVPAGAEMVIEGRISTDPKSFQVEGPFGEYTGFYGGMRQPRPTIRVECITYRDNPIFHGGPVGISPGHSEESIVWTAPMCAALAWKYLENANVPNIIAVWGPPITALANMRVQINKIYRGHAQQVAAALWGRADPHTAKNLIVVDKDIDVFDDEAVEWALAYRTNADMGAVQFMSNTVGDLLDPSTPLPQRNPMKYGIGKWKRMLIDATVNWELEPEEAYGGKREPPICTEISKETVELLNRRWKEYGL